MECFKVELENIIFDVSGVWEGIYRAETRYQPAEYPEFDITSICLKNSNVNLYDIFSPLQIEYIYEQINEK